MLWLEKREFDGVDADGRASVLPDSGADARRCGGCRIAADCADERPSGQPVCGRD